MHSIRRSCRTALFDSNSTSFLIANGSRRAFSRSAVHSRGALPLYLEPSSPELSQLLSALNSKALLPRHLTSEQQKLVYKPENRPKLEQEPIEITLGDVTLPLEHIDRMKDVPAYRKKFRQIMAASKTPEDWENLLRVMEGYHNAGLRIPRDEMIKAIRLLSQANMQHLILKALQRVEATGVRLRDFDLIAMVMRSVRDRAWQNNWSKEELQRTLRYSQQIVELMEHPEHLGKGPRNDLPDYRGHPSFVAVPAEMAAELSYRYDVELDTAKKYATRLMNALKQHEFLATEIEAIEALSTRTEDDFDTKLKHGAAIAELHNRLFPLIPVWNALSAARTVLDAEMPMAADAERVQRQLRDVLQKGEDCLERLRVRKGEVVASDAPAGLVGYIKQAIWACEEGAEEE